MRRKTITLAAEPDASVAHPTARRLVAEIVVADDTDTGYRDVALASRANLDALTAALEAAGYPVVFAALADDLTGSGP